MVATPDHDPHRHAGHDHAGHDHAGHDHAGQDHSGHGHGHAHGGHVHAPADFGRAFALGIGLNTAFVLVEALAGFYGHSIALLADAGHNISDVLGLVVAWLASSLSKRSPTARFTYGLGSSSILAALFNAVFLLVVVGALSLDAVQRLFDPAPVAGGTVMIVAAAGIAVNGVTAALFASGKDGDINIKGAYLHMAADALVSLGVVLAGGVILVTGWLWLDPLASLAVNAVIIVGTWSLLRDSLAMSMHGVPAAIEPVEVRRFLSTCSGVVAIHDLHVWPMSTTESALTAHLVMPDGHPGDGFLTDAAAGLRERFRIGHTTLQIETSLDGECPLASGHTV